MTFFAVSGPRTQALALFLTLGLSLSLFGTQAEAHDDEHRRIGGDKVSARWDADTPKRNKFQFKTKDQLQINDLPFSGANPTTDSSSLFIQGSGAHAGTTGVIYLEPERWKVNGKGDTWSYKGASSKSSATQGVRQIKVKKGKDSGGSLQIKGGGFAWPLALTGPQDSISIALSVGQYTFCAEFSEGDSPGTDAELRFNELGRFDGKESSPPVECPAVCGNGYLDLGEECDDGNDIDTDTCTNLCTSCVAESVEFNSTFEGIQSVIFDGYNCSNDACHGSAISGDLDLRDGTSFSQLVGVESASGNAAGKDRVFPGDQLESFLYLKMSAATLGTPNNVGTPMPVGGELTEEHLEAVKVWIRGGAPETGVVEGTAELLGSCLPAATPNKMPQPDVPDSNTGVQLAMPGYDLPSQSETELCVASYYDFSATGLIPPSAIIDCLGVFPGTNDHGDNAGKCFIYKQDGLYQDGQSHHSIINIYQGDYDWDDNGWGNWTCYLGTNDGLACDPSTANPCPGGGTCGGAARPGVACLVRSGPAYGPPDYGFANNNAPSFGGSQESTFIVDMPDGVYRALPLKGVVIWNSHAFNLTNEDMNMEAWLNLIFSDNPQYLSQVLFNSEAIFTQNVPPFEQREYCHTHTFPDGAQLFRLGSHTHKRGIRWRYYSPPQTPCSTSGGQASPSCLPGSPGDIFYTSTDYSDPVESIFDPPMAFSGGNDAAGIAARTMKFCSLFDNGDSDPALLKRQSTSPEPPIPLAPGGPCDDSETRCVGGVNKGELCFADDTNCPLSTCDACPVRGGVTTEDEMFIAIGSYFVP